jgi:mannose-6-phosphate isomerase-like protein (cupin superfamily)
MSEFVTRTVGAAVDVMAPDGSEVRLLATIGRGSMAHFRLPAGRVSLAVAHRTVEELWYFVGGRGRMWRRLGESEEIVDVRPGVSIAIPTGARFQFRADGDEALEAVGVTMPPWSGADEAYPVEGIWEASAGGAVGEAD